MLGKLKPSRSADCGTRALPTEASVPSLTTLIAIHASRSRVIETPKTVRFMDVNCRDEDARRSERASASQHTRALAVACTVARPMLPCGVFSAVALFAGPMRGAQQSNGSSDSEDPLARFRGLTIHETLRALLESDPLGLAVRADRALGARALFLDPQRVTHRLAARVAFEAELRDGGDLDAWLDALTKQSLGELLEEQRVEEANGIPSAQSEDSEYYAGLADRTQIDVELVRLVCVTLNELDESHRRVFHALAVERKSVDACVRDGLGTSDQLEQRFREAGYRIALALVDRYGDDTFSKESHGN